MDANSRDIVIDDRIRGVPLGTTLSLAEVGAQNWHPADGLMQLPVLTLEEPAFAANRDLMLRYAREQGVEIAPHAKTPMCPDLAASLVEAGAWGTTVADVRQASVMLKAGLNRLILANEVGGAGGAARLARLLAAHREAEVYAFADSLEAVAALAGAWRSLKARTALGLLVEIGSVRAGARSLAEAERLVAAIHALGADLPIRLAGAATYEGVAAKPDPGETRAAMADLLATVAETYRMARRTAGPERPLIVTAGGSSFFDLVVAALKPALADDPRARLVLRSGAIFFHDHGTYARSLAALEARRGFAVEGKPAAAAFKPALRIWAEVLSRPEPRLALCGMGMRDASFDHDLPFPLRVYRAGKPIATGLAPEAMRVVKLNDQHSYLALGEESPVKVGDVIEFGISHPCTALDRWRFIFGIDAQGRVRRAYPTYFG
jgi:D-serine dehydratase